MRSVFKKLWVRWLKRQGLQIADDCRLMGFPDFGSEPYLISIGKHVTISVDVLFVTHDGGTFVFRDQPRYEEVVKFGRITIHDNCFIGARTILMPGITVGPNAVVAAGAVVTKSVAPNTVVGGVPAKPICTVEQYAENALKNLTPYDRQAFLTEKKEELLRRFPRPW
jgi:acetyltransferase-like isoleucine patch superfamily enzyme